MKHNMVKTVKPMVNAPCVDPMAGTFLYELRRASAAVLMMQARAVEAEGLRPSEANLLLFIAANPGCTQSDIARVLRSKAANLVPLITRLETIGLVTRTAGAGRAIALSLTDTGGAVQQRIAARYGAMEAALREGMAKDDQSALLSQLAAMLKAACHFRQEED